MMDYSLNESQYNRLKQAARNIANMADSDTTEGIVTIALLNSLLTESDRVEIVAVEADDAMKQILNAIVEAE
jgi:hypothetical protein